MNHAKLLSEAFSALEKQAIRERINAATKGEWVADYTNGIMWNTEAKRVLEFDAIEYSEFDIEFIAHARTDIPRLLDALDERDREVEQIGELFDKVIEHRELVLEENQRLRKALEEIRDLPDVDADHRGIIARQALAGVE